jgi:hypothetical protein
LDTTGFSNAYAGTFTLVPNLTAKSIEIHYSPTGTGVPVVTIAYPADGQCFTAPAFVPVGIGVVENGYTIDSVTYIAGMNAGQVAYPSSEEDFLDLPAGRYEVSVWLIYESGAGACVVTSPTRIIYVLGPIETTSAGTGPDGNFQLTFTGPTGQPYRVLGTDDLTRPLDQWTELDRGNIPDTSATFTDTNTAARSQQFYRVVSP